MVCAVWLLTDTGHPFWTKKSKRHLPNYWALYTHAGVNATLCGLFIYFLFLFFLSDDYCDFFSPLWWRGSINQIVTRKKNKNKIINIFGLLHCAVCVADWFCRWLFAFRESRGGGGWSAFLSDRNGRFLPVFSSISFSLSRSFAFSRQPFFFIPVRVTPMDGIDEDNPPPLKKNKQMVSKSLYRKKKDRQARNRIKRSF